jgi:putative intracellular protease/amidase
MLGFLHTSPVHVASFDRLLCRLAPDLAVRHEVRPDLLETVLGAGAITDSVRLETAAALSALAGAGARVIVCTCSTLGGLAEASPAQGALVLRVDRPMAERAVASGRRVLVAAALPSTLPPTVALLRQISDETGQTVELVETICHGAWPLFEAGDFSAYAKRIAEAVEREARARDTVVLAQASMAPAADLLRHLDITVLSSPELGVEAAVSRLRALGASGPP